ncbi:MAG: ABC transporter ATP-binding protein [Lentihominibacter sp.]|jgi:ABC-2 type transport system ATP-binding protein
MKGNSFCIEVSNVNKSFGKKQILHDISLNVPEGGICGLIGPSGCGKTTLVRIIAGILKASSGSVHIEGAAIPSLEKMADIGYMAQSIALYDALTVRENLQFFGKLQGLREPELSRRIDSVTSLVDLKEKLDSTVASFSGGMKQRLSLAIAVIHRPRILILDEPTVGIDPLLRYQIWSELRKLTENGVTILITTHVMDEAKKCDRIALMRQGHILANGSVSDLMKNTSSGSLEEAFIYYSKGGDIHENTSSDS